MRDFSDEQRCREFLARLRWNGNPVCPYCSSTKSYVIEGGKRYKCGNNTCYKKYSVTVGTVFHGSNIPLSTWFPAMYLVSSQKRGISSIQLAKHLGVTQKTCWFMIHRIREALRQKNSPLLGGTGGIVEADSSYVGGKIGNKHYKERKEYAEHKNWKLNKTTIVGIVDRKGGADLQVSNLDSDLEQLNIVKSRLEFASQIVTDEANCFTELNKEHYHYKVNHSKNEYARLHFHTNTVEGMFSHFDRMIIGTYFQVSKKHLQRYCDEFISRYNTRKMKDGERFEISLQNIEGKLTYKQLVYGKSSQESQKNSQENT